MNEDAAAVVTQIEETETLVPAPDVNAPSTTMDPRPEIRLFAKYHGVLQPSVRSHLPHDVTSDIFDWP